MPTCGLAAAGLTDTLKVSTTVEPKSALAAAAGAAAAGDVRAMWSTTTRPVEIVVVLNITNAVRLPWGCASRL